MFVFYMRTCELINIHLKCSKQSCQDETSFEDLQNYAVLVSKGMLRQEDGKTAEEMLMFSPYLPSLLEILKMQTSHSLHIFREDHL